MAAPPWACPPHHPAPSRHGHLNTQARVGPSAPKSAKWIPQLTDGGGKFSASQKSALRVLYIPLPRSQDPKHLCCNTRPAGVGRREAGRDDTSFQEEESHEVVVPGPSEAEEGMGPSPSRVWAGKAWDLQEGAVGLATSQQPALLSQTLSATLHNADPSFQRWWEEKPQAPCGGNIPTESGGGRQAPSLLY